MIRIFALNLPVHVISEQRSKSYKWYDARVAQLKHVLGVKNDLQDQICSGLEGRGA